MCPVSKSKYLKVKVKWSRYRPGVAQRVGRGIALRFHDRGTGRGWMVSSTPRPLFTPGKEPVPILQEAVWTLGSVWRGGKSRPHPDSIPDRPARSQSLYRLSYRDLKVNISTYLITVYVQFYVILDAMCSLVMETALSNNAISLNKLWLYLLKSINPYPTNVENRVSS